ncbi:MAG TPA: glycerol-3-phosphate 1-O-acyltransferase PlsY [Candidatus Pullilachnospira stercoravium]|uniref:Glycerol-3-phosphate acyltransferase n=1 Tax=Candidatus Pullilachnospira stercoravium TaxID=2840913 RepID=A0A9D1T5R2_9FIRM|nr:glycerol-3-phosphate 1-O-acyltransferase PlsY [Candidatus Pullilachnospira stercoravium]
MVERLICLLIGYVCGLFQTSYIYGRAHGIDIRNYGSGNAGTTNALRTLGAKAGAITFLGDCFKCVIAVLIVRVIFGNSHQDIIRLLGLYAAAGTILGHNFPFYLKFRGGKGIAATAGLLISFDWRISLAALIVFLIVFLTTHYVSLGSLLVYVVFLAGLACLGQMGAFGMEASALHEMYILAFLLAVLAFYKHRANIGRLLHGNENKTYLKKKK